MDFTRAPSLIPPPLAARCAPVYWRPSESSRERLTALLCIEPTLESTALLAPGVHVILNEKRLRPMLGSERAGSAVGIFRACAEFMAKRLLAGAALEDLQPLFKGFEIGTPIKIKGFGPEQLIDAAVRTMSAFASSADIADEVASAPNKSTPTTRVFLDKVQRMVSLRSPSLAKHFALTLALPEANTEISVDYARNRHVVQFASLPMNERQDGNMRREYESKLFEAITARQHVNALIEPLLVINVRALAESEDALAARGLAERCLADFRAFAHIHRMTVCEAKTEEEAAFALERLD